MRTGRSKYLSDIPIEENHYKVDFNILDKYQSFSSEILRLALLGLAVYGFLITDVIFKISKGDKLMFLQAFIQHKNLLFSGALILLGAALAALLHRYYSTDCMTHFVRRFRLRKKLAALGPQESMSDEEKEELMNLEEKIATEDSSFESDLKLCKWLLIFASLFLILGIGFVIAGVGKTLLEVSIGLNNKTI